MYGIQPCGQCPLCEHSAKKRRRVRLPQTPELAAQRELNKLRAYRKQHGEEKFTVLLALIQRGLLEENAA